MRTQRIINNINTIKTNQPSFKGPIDGPLTQFLTLIDTNPMASAALVDTSAMVLPRTYVDTKKRNKYAGAETFFREATGTVIVCLSGGVIARGIAGIYNKVKYKDVKVNPSLWATNESFDTLKNVWNDSKSSNEYAKNVLGNISGRDGKKIVKLSDVNWDDVKWIDSKSWSKIHWKNQKFNNIQDKLKTQDNVVNLLGELIEDKNLDKRDAKNLVKILDARISNALGVSASVNLKSGEKSVNSSVKNVVRDSYQLAREIFANKEIDIEQAAKKIKLMNRSKTIGAIGIAASAGLADQYINRLITKKRRGKDEFVGTIGQVQDKKKDNKLVLNLSKAAASLGIVALALKVMSVKSASDFVKKLEFSSIATSGNVIKTIYTSLLVGRFLASRNNDELRETATRDYLGFLNWLVVGGFVSKGVGQLLFDRKLDKFFNVSGETKGVKNWLNNISLKSHAEIASKGEAFAKKNIWKLNVMHLSGLLYSGLALGFALPILNIFLTNKEIKSEKNPKTIQKKS